jgi:hypothetical protein
MFLREGGRRCRPSLLFVYFLCHGMDGSWKGIPERWVFADSPD